MSETFTINEVEPKVGRPSKVREDKPPRTIAPKVASSASTPADVKKAMASLESAYNLIATGLFIFGLTETADEWTNSAEQLKASNEEALKAAPKVAKAIASAGGTGGVATLLLTHGMAVVGVMKVAQTELRNKRGVKNETPETLEFGNQEPMNYRDPTLIPGM